MATVRSLNKRSTTILIASVLALGTGLLAFNYLTTVNKTATVVPMRTVVVAALEIPVRTIVRPSMLTISSRPANSVDPDAVSSEAEVVGQIALISIPSGGVVSESKIGRLGLGGLTMHIPSGLRAISISLDRVKGVANLIQAGDHVDVLAVTAPRGQGAVAGVSTILKNKVVLAMGTTQEAPAAAELSGATPPPDLAVETATLAVTPQEAKILALADLNSTLRLALRSIKDGRVNEAAEPFAIPTTSSAVNPGPPPQAGPAPQQHQAAPAAPKRLGPPLIDGDRFVDR
ncbi:MAG: Flp pilus assembly protein CpaB [Candidatus Velthaea sp.]|jgi:pilus assembly protein CpaB